MFDCRFYSKTLDSRRLYPRQLRKGVKMRIPRVKDERILEDEGRNPHIVRGDRSALLPQLPVSGRIMMGCLLICIKNTNAGLKKETAQNSFIARPLAAYGKTGTQFPEYNERQPNLIGAFDHLDRG